ncbi:MAG: GNAT family N-acetyltransferase [Anaerolineae bacterium]|nr:GNAT family N-acetyltransferase [Anaerolineae bacterium]
MRLAGPIQTEGGVFASIRPVARTPSDAAVLLAVEKASLGDSDYGPDEALAVLQRPEHHAYLAQIGEACVGFCSCLETPGAEGPRLEVDMLGVVPAWRGQGIATALVAFCMGEALARGTHTFRAVIAEGNLASQRTFERVGFACSQSVQMLVYALHGWAPIEFLPAGWAHRGDRARRGGGERHSLIDAGGSVVALAECLPVHTLAYVGLWIENIWGISPEATRLMARALVERAKQLACDEVGYLLPLTDGTSYREPLLREGFAEAGRYRIYKAGNGGRLGWEARPAAAGASS